MVVILLLLFFFCKTLSNRQIILFKNNDKCNIRIYKYLKLYKINKKYIYFPLNERKIKIIFIIK
jgi:hypothetical protein